MYELLIQDLESAFPGKAFISAEEVCRFLGCEIKVVYNWNKRNDPRKRPPSLIVGKQLRFQKRLLARWLADEQSQGSDR